MTEKYLFPVIKTEPVPDPYAGERSVYEPGICMRRGCGEPRWKHPEKGELVLCQFHAEEVFRGEAKAPPLRQNRDYDGSSRRTFLVDPLPDLPVSVDPKTPEKS